MREYFSFTKKERVAVVALVTVILAAYFLPHFIRPASKKPSAIEIAEFKKAETEFKRNDKVNVKEYEPKEHSPPARLFYFDPNTITAEGWEQLGLRSKTIGTILKYLSKGGHFNKADDLKKIYGLHAVDYARLAPYVRINKTWAKKDTTYVRAAPVYYKAPAYKKTNIIDINDADSAAFIALNGIGAKLAARIIAFREKLGGFYNIDQLSETYGLPDSTFQSIRAFLSLSNPNIRRINPNTAALETLKQHPYIRWSLASAIIRYREQHGPFTSLQDLQQIAQITPAIYTRLLPYLTLSE